MMRDPLRTDAQRWNDIFWRGESGEEWLPSEGDWNDERSFPVGEGWFLHCSLSKLGHQLEIGHDSTPKRLRLAFTDMVPTHCDLMQWRELQHIASAIERTTNDRYQSALALALLQRFAPVTRDEHEDYTIVALIEAHRTIGALSDPDPFVRDTMRYTRGRWRADRDGFMQLDGADWAVRDGGVHASFPRRAFEALLHVAHCTSRKQPVDTALVRTALADFESDEYAEVFDEASEQLGKGRELAERDAAAAREASRRSADLYMKAEQLATGRSTKADCQLYCAAALVDLSERLELDEAIAVLENAAARFVRASELWPSLVDGKRRAADTFHRLGNRVAARDPRKAAEVYRQGAQRANELLDVTTDPASATATLGVVVALEVLQYQALLSVGERAADEHLAAAVRAADRQRELGGAAFNAACAYALANHHDRAIDVLEIVVPRDQLTSTSLETDEDLASLRGHPRFVALLDKAFRPDK